MPPRFKFTREEVIEAAVKLTRESGIAAVTARKLAAELGSSAKPIFGLFENMEEVQHEVLNAASQLYTKYTREEVASGKYLPYKAIGMAYIRFAKEEKELFKLLYMRDRSNEKLDDGNETLKPVVELIQQQTGLSEENAFLLQVEMWVYVHGIATMIATSYLEWDMDFVSSVLTDEYEGLKCRFIGKERQNGSN